MTASFGSEQITEMTVFIFIKPLRLNEVSGFTNFVVNRAEYRMDLFSSNVAPFFDYYFL